MHKEVSTFHSGRYSFISGTSADMSVLNEALNVFNRMPLFPDVVAGIKEKCVEKAVFHEANIEDNTVTFDQVCRIIIHDRSNFSQDTKAINTINIYMAMMLVNSRVNTELSPDIITAVHNELITGLPHIKDITGQYRKGGAKADEKWLSEPYTPPGSTLDINFLIKNLLEWLEGELKDEHPIVKAFLLHLHLKKIQPYNNSNGHTARIMEQWYLKKHNIKLLPYLLPVIYQKNIEKYYKCISDFYQTADPASFIQFVSEALRPVVEEIRNKNFSILGNIVSDHYLTKLLENKTLIKRQYDFLSEMKKTGLTFTYDDMQLKKPFTKFYGNVSRTTVARDLKKFEDLNLIKATASGYTFNTDLTEQ